MIPYFEDVPQFKLTEKKYEVSEKVIDFDEYLSQKHNTGSLIEPAPAPKSISNFTEKKKAGAVKKTVYDLAGEKDWRDVSAD